MRLLNTISLSLEEFQPGSIPDYAILSHRWGNPEDEVLFSDMVARTRKSVSKRGFAKLLNTCKQAQSDGYAYVWVDTCCIDKKSSSELTEAINSMFQWYEDSAVCYAYLADLTWSNEPYMTRESRPIYDTIGNSTWFTRGWTLQELLAPNNVVFFDSQWTKMGTKSELRDEIFRITGIGIGYLERWAPIQSASIAHRMSWMANRITTRPEDTAYCLLGIFSVHMPLLYGEGDRAYLRLQEEIMKGSYDQSLFAWLHPEASPGPTGILATSPRYFQSTGHILPSFTSSEPYAITNRGLRISLHLQNENRSALSVLNGADQVTSFENDRFLATLDCIDGQWPGETNRLLAIVIARAQRNSDDFLRVNSEFLGVVPYHRDSATQTIYMATHYETSEHVRQNEYGARLLIKTTDLHNFTLRQFQSVESNDSWASVRDIVIKIPQAAATVAYAMVFEKVLDKRESRASQYGARKAVMIAIGSNYPPHLRFGPKSADRTSRDLDYIAFDAHVRDMNSFKDPAQLLPTARELFTPYTLGLELFVGSFAVIVKQAPWDGEFFDPTILKASIRIRELNGSSYRPPNGIKWQRQATRVNVHYLEMEDTSPMES